MYILTRSKSIENYDSIILRLQAADLEEQYETAGYKRYERIYKIKYQYKEYIVICPEFRKGSKGSEPIIIIPEFLIPRRSYPVYIYLYAIEIYSNNPNMGQRKAAEETRKQFGLTHFVHSTLGRVLKTFVNNIKKIENPTENNPDKTISESSKDSETQNISDIENNVQKNDSLHRNSFPTRHLTEQLCNQASKYLNGKIIEVCFQQAIELYYVLVRKWFKEYQQLLL